MKTKLLQLAAPPISLIPDKGLREEREKKKAVFEFTIHDGKDICLTFGFKTFKTITM